MFRSKKTDWKKGIHLITRPWARTHQHPHGPALPERAFLHDFLILFSTHGTEELLVITVTEHFVLHLWAKGFRIKMRHVFIASLLPCADKSGSFPTFYWGNPGYRAYSRKKVAMPGPACFSGPRQHVSIRPGEDFKMSPNHPVTQRGKKKKGLVTKITCLDIKSRGLTGKVFFHL